MTHRPLVFVDTETTGTSARAARLLEIGALRVENNRVVKTYKQIIDPGTRVPPFITKLTGIKNQDIAGMPRFGDVAQDLQELFDDAIFVAHNVNFDYSFFKAEFAQAGKAFNKDRLCTVRLSRALYPAQKSHRLDEVIRIHGYKVTNRHRAFDDAEVLYKFYTDHLEKLGLELYRVMNHLLISTRTAA